VGIASTFFAGRRAARLDSVLNRPARTPYTVFMPSNTVLMQLKEKGPGLNSSTGQCLVKFMLIQFLCRHEHPRIDGN